MREHIYTRPRNFIIEGWADPDDPRVWYETIYNLDTMRKSFFVNGNLVGEYDTTDDEIECAIERNRNA